MFARIRGGRIIGPEGQIVDDWQGLFFWGFLVVFGAIMYGLAPRARDEAGFFRGHDARGRPSASRRSSCSRAGTPV